MNQVFMIVTMAEGRRRRSLAQIVVRFSANNSLAFLEDDRTFFGGDSESESTGDWSDGDKEPRLVSAETITSDAEETLDEAPAAAPDQPLAQARGNTADSLSPKQKLKTCWLALRKPVPAKVRIVFS